MNVEGQAAKGWKGMVQFPKDQDLPLLCQIRQLNLDKLHCGGWRWPETPQCAALGGSGDAESRV